MLRHSMFPLFLFTCFLLHLGRAAYVNLEAVNQGQVEKLNRHSQRVMEKALCTTQECVVAAAALLESMDRTADPCQDFFQYACGGWNQKHPIPDSKTMFTQFDVLNEELYNILKEILIEEENVADPDPVNAARKFYAACTNTALLDSIGLKPLTDFLSLFGGWPMTLDQWAGQFSWKDATVAGIQKYNQNYFFLKVYNSLDANDTSLNAIYIDQPVLGLPRAVLVNPEGSPEVINAYGNFIRDSAKLIASSLGSTVTDDEISNEVNDMIRFESQLAEITTSSEDRRNNTRLYNPFLVNELQAWTDSISATTENGMINWESYLDDIYAIAEVDVGANERIIVRETEYLKKLLRLLDVTPTRTIANYIHWRFVMYLGYYTNSEMVNLALTFSEVLLGVSQLQPRSTSCIRLANNLMDYALSSKYVQRAFDEEAKAETEVMVSNLKIAFKTLVDDASWMDGTTKALAKEKVDYMLELIGYPDWILDTTALENYYSGLEAATDSHFVNVQNANTINNIREFKELREPVDRSRWKLAPSFVNAAYDAQRNSIAFPAAILQPPFFGKGRLAAMNYGGIGSVIGHEITHGFDDRGRQNDKFGNIADWWTQETAANYLERAQCFIEQYSNFTVPSGSHVNGVTTQGENIADNGGLREAFRAYNLYIADNGADPQLPGLEEFSAEQIFFLSFANMWCGHETPESLEVVLVTDPHSPMKYRVLGSVANNEDFAQHFNCPVGSPMNRETDCIIW